MWSILHHQATSRYVATLVAEDNRRITADFSKVTFPDRHGEVADPWPSMGHDVPVELRREWAETEVSNLLRSRLQNDRLRARLLATREGIDFVTSCAHASDDLLLDWAAEVGIPSLSANDIRVKLRRFYEA